MMAGDDKKTKANPTPKNEGPAKKKSTSDASPSDASPSGASPSDASPSDASPSDASPSKAEGGETAAATPANYSRGEGQKPVTKAYKDNWNAIFAKKKKKR
jgi:hypothetical protein